MMMRMFKTLAFVLALLFVLHSVSLVYPGTSFANPDVTIKHTPPTCITSHYPYRFWAVISAQSEIDDVRLYFKTQGALSDYFVHMQPQAEHTYVGIMPAPVEAGFVIEYGIAVYRNTTEIARSAQFFTFTESETDCPIAELPATNRPIVVYSEKPALEEIGFSGGNVEWKTSGALNNAQPLTRNDPKTVPQQSTASEKSENPAKKGSIFGLPPLSTKAMIGIGLGVGAATAAGVALLTKKEETIAWTLDPQDLDDKIKVEIIKTPNAQTTCGTVVSNSLYVTNTLSTSLSVTSIDYEVILTRERPSGGCDPGRIGTFAPNWAVIVASGERALVRQWSNEVNPCSGCPYMDSQCRWNSKYVVHTTLGSGEAETEFSSEGNLCSASAGKAINACIPPNADVEP